MSDKLAANAINQIRELATQAYGHGSDKAGSGRIGMIGGHVVKFNTHYDEWHSTAGSMADMRASCDALRTHLYNIARNVYGEEISKGMQKILSKLGFDTSGRMQPRKDLLSRSIVAKFVDQLKRDSADVMRAVGGVRGGATLTHTKFAEVRTALMSGLTNRVLDDIRNRRVEGEFASAAMDVLGSLDPEQGRLFSEFLVARIASYSDNFAGGTQVYTTDVVRSMLDRMVRGNVANMIDGLKCLGRLLKDGDVNAAKRLLEMMVPCQRFTAGMEDLMNSVRRWDPDALKSQKTFAAELKRRLGLGERLTSRESADARGTIARLGNDLVKKAMQYDETAETVKIGKMSLRTAFDVRAEMAVKKAEGANLLPAGCDLKGFSNRVSGKLRLRCRLDCRFTLTDADVKIALFNVICDSRVREKRADMDPDLNLLKNADMLRLEGDICNREVDELASMIDKFSGELADKFVAFRANRECAYGVARGDIAEIGRDFGLDLTDGDINMKEIDAKFASKEISFVDSSDKVRAVVDKRVNALRKLAADLKASTVLSAQAKRAIFKRVCSMETVPGGAVGRVEALVSAYETDLSKVLPGLLAKMDNRQHLDAKGLDAQYKILTQSVLKDIRDVVVNYQVVDLEFSADDCTSVIVLFGEAVAADHGSETLDWLGHFVNDDDGYKTWLQKNGSKVFDCDAMTFVLNYAGPLVLIRQEMETGNRA